MQNWVQDNFSARPIQVLKASELLVFTGSRAQVPVCSWHKGFLASLAELIGAVFGVGIAVWASQTAAPQIYEKFLSASVANRVELALRESNGNIAEALQGISFLPESMQQSLLNLLNDAGSDVPAKIAEALQPLILPFVQVLLFVVLCVLVRWVFRLLVGALRWFNGVPLLGSVNRLLGLVLGLANGAVDCWLLALALWQALLADRLHTQPKRGLRHFRQHQPLCLMGM